MEVQVAQDVPLLLPLHAKWWLASGELTDKTEEEKADEDGDKVLVVKKVDELIHFSSPSHCE
jgi:hypothetical protein